MANESSGIVEKDVRVLQRKSDGKYYICSLTSDFEEEATDCDLKYLLMGRERRFNVLDSIKTTISADPIFVRKIQRVSNGFILRLSNRHIQFLLDDSNYLLAGRKMWEVVGSKERELNTGKVMAGTAKGNKEHLRVIRQVMTEIEAKKEEFCKENRPK